MDPQQWKGGASIHITRSLLIITVLTFLLFTHFKVNSYVNGFTWWAMKCTDKDSLVLTYTGFDSFGYVYGCFCKVSIDIVDMELKLLWCSEK